ncbi:hypothetical protein LTR56_011544 [Elasticomyces elasticus]|nr:hypothetical protein LTR56_011544 [Elasticomyces elasticus]KAK3643273.1 hypothetical protein LTR22_015740 [Elasticomyces elasticus]KAK4930263.1 hypothetical protein LTR49_003297 [Elasticomyces elasticus]KAK5763167.1 hypothetical protein LTS12_006756 [Elasticomyces elasticus]
MSSSLLRQRTLYLDLYRLTQPRGLPQTCHNRSVSTTSAINRGLKATRGGSSSFGGRRDGGRDEKRPGREGSFKPRDRTGTDRGSDRRVESSRGSTRDSGRPTTRSYESTGGRRPYGEERPRRESKISTTSRSERRSADGGGRSSFGSRDQGSRTGVEQRRTRFDTSTLSSAARPAFYRERKEPQDDDRGASLGREDRGSRSSSSRYGAAPSSPPSAFGSRRTEGRDGDQGGPRGAGSYGERRPRRSDSSAFDRSLESAEKRSSPRDDRGGGRGDRREGVRTEDRGARSPTSSFGRPAFKDTGSYSGGRSGSRDDVRGNPERRSPRSEYGQRDSRTSTSPRGTSAFGRPPRDDHERAPRAARDTDARPGRDRPRTALPNPYTPGASGRGDRRFTPEDVEDNSQLNEAFTKVRQIAGLVETIQSGESGSGSGRSRLESNVEEARQLIADLNEQFPDRSLGDRGSVKREVVFYLRRTLEAQGLFRKLGEGGADQAEQTMVVEVPGHSFSLVLKGETADPVFERAPDRSAGEQRRDAKAQRANEDDDSSVRTGKQEAKNGDESMQDVRRVRELLWALRARARKTTARHDEDSTVPSADIDATNERNDRLLKHELSGLFVKLGLFSNVDPAALQRVGSVLKKGNAGFRHVAERTKSGAVERVVFKSKGDDADVFELAFDKAGAVTIDKAPAIDVQHDTEDAAVRDAPEAVLSQMNAALQPEIPVWDRSSQAIVDEPITAEEVEDEDAHPVSVPYTTAASEFLYGTNVVLAALRAKRRKLYRLHIHPRLFNREGASRDIEALADRAGLKIERNADLRLLDKMSDSRPHNGVVLETSRLPAPPVLAMGAADGGSGEVSLILDKQNTEDAAINGTLSALSTAQTWRRPFVLMLDGIVDPGNVGNILRTAHFYGVDAVAIATATCCSLTSAVLAKASSGACEAVPLLALPKPSSFVVDSAKDGWRIYAAVAPSAGNAQSGPTVKEVVTTATTSTIAMDSPLRKDPIILMLGAEGEGLRANLIRQADCLVSIEQARSVTKATDVGVDSLNVSVAAGVLMEAFLQKPLNTEEASTEASEEPVEEPTVKGELGF